MRVHITVRGVAPLYKIFGKKKEIDFEFSGNTVKEPGGRVDRHVWR